MSIFVPTPESLEAFEGLLLGFSFCLRKVVDLAVSAGAALL
jgi:hypothetical protein